MTTNPVQTVTNTAQTLVNTAQAVTGSGQTVAGVTQTVTSMTQAVTAPVTKIVKNPAILKNPAAAVQTVVATTTSAAQPVAGAVSSAVTGLGHTTTSLTAGTSPTTVGKLLAAAPGELVHPVDRPTTLTTPTTPAPPSSKPVTKVTSVLPGTSDQSGTSSAPAAIDRRTVLAPAGSEPDPVASAPTDVSAAKPLITPAGAGAATGSLQPPELLFLICRAQSVRRLMTPARHLTAPPAGRNTTRPGATRFEHTPGRNVLRPPTVPALPRLTPAPSVPAAGPGATRFVLLPTTSSAPASSDDAASSKAGRPSRVNNPGRPAPLKLPGLPDGSSTGSGAAGTGGTGLLLLFAVLSTFLLVTPRFARWFRASAELRWSPVVLSILERPG